MCNKKKMYFIYKHVNGAFRYNAMYNYNKNVLSSVWVVEENDYKLKKFHWRLQ